MEKVSVIIPVYNVRPYLPEALDSVICQTYPNLEIILIDDGSTDGSALICDQYATKDSRIKVIHQENQGLSAARNTGLDCFSGEFITFLDSDDALHPDAIRRMVGIIINEDVDIVVCHSMAFYTEARMTVDELDKGMNYQTPGILISENPMKAVIDRTVPCMAWGKLYRAEIWRGLRYPSGHVHEDYYIILDVIERAKSVYIMNDALIMYRKRADSITSGVTLLRIRDLVYAYKHYADCVRIHTPAVFTNNQLRKVLSEKLNTMIATAINVADINQERKEIQAYLRSEIISFVKQYSIHSFVLRTRIFFLIFLHFPWILKILYDVYNDRI